MTGSHVIIIIVWLEAIKEGRKERRKDPLFFLVRKCVRAETKRPIPGQCLKPRKLGLKQRKLGPSWAWGEVTWTPRVAESVRRRVNCEIFPA